MKASGRSKTHHGLALSADFLTPKEPFCTCVVSPESRGRGWRSGRERGDHLILYPNRIFPLFVPAVAVILRCLQEIKPGCLPCLSCYFYFRWQTGGWLLMLYLEPTHLLSQEMQTGGWLLSIHPEAHFFLHHEMQQEASCKCLICNPSISCLKLSLQEWVRFLLDSTYMC